MSDQASQEARLRLLSEGVAAFNRGDHAAALAIFAPDVECYVAPELINAGTFHGHEGYIEMITTWGEAWETVEAQMVEVADPDPDHVLVEIRQSAVGAGSGVPVEMTLYWLFRFRDGLVIRFDLYGDRESALGAVGRG